MEMNFSLCFDMRRVRRKAPNPAEAGIFPDVSVGCLCVWVGFFVLADCPLSRERRKIPLVLAGSLAG